MGITVVDGNNVIGAVPDGWWKDRPGAARRLHRRLVIHLGHLHRAGDDVHIVLVLDVPQPDLPAGDNDGIEVRYPTHRGRDAADDEIVRYLDDLRRMAPLPTVHQQGEEPPPPGPPVTVVTSDRALAVDARDRGATVIGARTFLRQLESEANPS